jgi:hypothetical protein
MLKWWFSPATGPRLPTCQNSHSLQTMRARLSAGRKRPVF